MADAARIGQAAGRIRTAVVGRSESLGRLFDYLVETSAAGQRPKEYEVAQAVFGRGPGFDGAQDASVRVAAHRLRRKLQEFYAGPGRADPDRLDLPRGEYRLALVHGRRPARASWLADRWPLALGLAALLAVNLAGWGLFLLAQSPDRELAEVRRSALWAPLMASKTPTLLVLGDYYIFGETDPGTGIPRLIREFTVNSREDLDAFLAEDAAARARSRDLGLTYLPAGAGAALRSIAPVLGPDARARVVLASDLTPDMLKQNDIVYVGYFSGLGLLKGAVFAGSRYQIGETYDELVDVTTGDQFVSEEGGWPAPNASHRDYGYLASFRGPEGRRILVVAGARDAALMEAAEAAVSPDALHALDKAARRTDAFEALYEVDGVRRRNLAGRLMAVSPRRSDRSWSAQAFPRG
jgi:hypothetical protein